MLCKIVCVMEMDKSLFMCLHNIFRKQETLRDVLADLTGHIITLYAVDRRILVGILLLDFLVVTLEKT